MKRKFTRLFVFLLPTLLPFLLNAQTYENSWINFSQDYYKVKVWQDGIYRLSYGALIGAGVPISGWKASRIQLFHNGVEQYIYIFDQNSNDTINSSDYIEFYGQKNDGSFDTKMYADSTWQPNVRYSLITDTSIYFLTVSNISAGKRLTLQGSDTDTAYLAYQPSSYFIDEAYYEETTNTYLPGGYSPNEDIDYVSAEGWVGQTIGEGGTMTKTVATPNIYTNGPNIAIAIATAGANNNSHQMRIAGPSINQTESSSGYVMMRDNFNLSPVSLSSSNNFTFSSINTGTTDRIAFVNISIKYPHTFDMEGQNVFKMYIPDDSQQSKTRLDFTNFTGASPILYDITNHKRITVNSTLHALVDNDGNASPKYCYLASASQIAPIYSNSISRINYVSSSGFSRFNDLRAVAKDSAFIMVTTGTFIANSSINGYKDYRNTNANSAATNNRVVVVDVEELYDQFAYGQKNHGLGIKNFIRFTLDNNNWHVPHIPQALFLVGKSIQPDIIRHDPASWSQCLVASYGYPTSDMMLVTEINGSKYDPVVPVGRLSAKNAGDINNYLSKVEEYEAAQATVPPAEWMKEVLHFGGGADINEQTTFRTYLDNLKKIIEDTSYGAHVTSYFKTDANPIQINPSDSLKNKINNGVSAMLFFGHASGSSFDVSTDDPNNYGNTGKYPVVMASSCFAGNFHTGSLSNSEQFVLAPERAAIAFLASVGLGFSGYLYDYDTALYRNLSANFYGYSIGKIIKETIKKIQNYPFADSLYVKQVVQEMSLQGDPVLKFNSWPKTDLVADEKNIFFTPSLINSQTDTFTLHFVTRNYGKAVTDTFPIRIDRKFPDGTDSIYVINRSRCYYADTLAITMRVGGINGAGVNKFNIREDLDTNRIDELTLNNNETNTSLFIYSSDITPVYPSKYAIYPYSTVTLKASTVNPLGPLRTYLFEMDTAYFNGSPRSGQYHFGLVQSSGGVVSWSPSNYTLLDNTVYYWRVYDDTTIINKSESSFIRITGKTGWSQAHYYQYKNDGYINVNRDTVNRKYLFVPNVEALHVVDYRDPSTNATGNGTGYYLNNILQEDNGGCHGNQSSGIMVAVIDSLDLLPWNNCNVFHGQINTIDCNHPATTGICRTRLENYFAYSFSQPVTSFDTLNQWINSIPNGHYILIYSWATNNYSALGAIKTDLDAMFSGLGITEWQSVQNNAPFIYFVKKGGGYKVTRNGTPTDTSITLDALMQNQWYRGNVTSEVIGPAARWTSLHWSTHSLEATNGDSINLMVKGLNSTTGIFDTLINNITTPNIDVPLTSIDPHQYPYLQLSAYLQDIPTRTPPQLDKWQVYYDEEPECALNANRQYSFYKSPLQEGDTMKMSIAIENIGNVAMDSLPVSFYMYDKNRIRHDIKNYKLDSLRVGRWLTANLTIDTTFGYNGSNSLWVEANPFDSRHLPEQYHFNNLAEVKFNINRDMVNPILDVVFDGVHILDGDIVSGKPHITIGLKDENRFLALNDTSKFHVYLKSPTGQTKQPLYFTQASQYGGATMRFTPAALPKNSCKIEFDPVFSEDGIYSLEVEATDRSDNESGKYNYRITFEVINKSSITQVLNYPNPFTTSTRFVFVLTGNEVPDHMRIRIMTITGKVVREIMRNELGNIHIGRNITDYAWDGKDQYGDQLGNGVYLYHVDTEFSSGETIDHRASDADKYFKKNWGKLYLMR